MARLSIACPFLLLSACAAPAGSALRESSAHASIAQSTPVPRQQPFPVESRSGHAWRPGQALMHGFFGVTEFKDVSVETGGPGHVDGDQGNLDDLPVIGGGAQLKLGGERIDLGLEGMLSFSWSSDAAAFVVGGGGAAVAVDVDLLIFELYGGPFASLFLGDELRLYGGAGPIMQWANYDQDDLNDVLDDDGSGFGYGWYARTGLEFALESRTFLGFGVRWSDTSVDLGSSLGDLEIDGLQAVITVSRGV
jgi:opacity protein-like surface antigen